MKKFGLVALAFALCAPLAACSDPEPVDATHQGELTDSDPRVEQDDSPYDEYTFDAMEGWNITATMESENFDTFLWLIGPSSTSLQQNDDANPGTNTNSAINFTAPEGGTYTIRANSYDSSGRGSYNLHIVAGPSGQ